MGWGRMVGLVLLAGAASGAAERARDAAPSLGEVTGELRLEAGVGAREPSAWREQGASLREAARSALRARGLSPRGEPARPSSPLAGQVIPGEFIVRFEDEAPQRSAAAVAQALAVPGLSVSLRADGPPGLELVRVAPDGLQAQGLPEPTSEAFAQEVVRRLAARPGVRWVEPNRWAGATATPNDDFFPLQWHYGLANLPAAWDLTRGSSRVTVAVVDSGIRVHPDLRRVGLSFGRVLAGYDFVSDVANAGDGNGRDPNPRDEGGLPGDPNYPWHGLHIAGTIAAATNNARGVAGVNWQVRLLPVRALGRNGMGSVFDIASGAHWAAGGTIAGIRRNTRPAHVVNLSLGGPGAPSPTYQDVIDRHPRTTFVVAAGNDNADAGNFFPCNQRDVICVGSVGPTGQRSSFSNSGGPVDVMAPGGENSDVNGDGYLDGVLSTGRDNATGRSQYTFLLGTSMAVPHVAGVVALMHAVRRITRPGVRLSRTDVEAILKATASPTPGCPTGCGAGLINAAAAVAVASSASTRRVAELGVTTPEVFLVGGGTQALGVANQGDAPLAVTATVEGVAAARVSFPRGVRLEVPARSVRPLELAVDARGLGAGTHEATVRLDAGAAGSASVAVHVRVADAGTADAVVAFAHRDARGRWQVDPGGVARVSAKDHYRYALRLPPGPHVAIAALDEDGDGEFFEDGERVALWRDLAPIEVRAGERVDGIELELAR